MARRIAFGSYHLSVDDFGTSGSPVIAVHSTGMNGRQWKRLAERLAPDHRVALPDLLGCGGSDPWPRDAPFSFMLDVLGVEALIDAAGEPVHLIGHSYGGLVALHAALHRRAQIRSLALVEPVAFGVLHARGEHEVLAAIEAMPYRTPVLPHAPDASERWLTWFVEYWNGKGAFAALNERMRAAFVESAHVCYGEVVSLLADRTPESVWATVNVPTLFVRGEHSPSAARRVVDVLVEALPDARKHEIAGAGHMSPLTHPDAVIDRIADHVHA
jgi:pimeloyl-ACP methyl ester carboxylesterase